MYELIIASTLGNNKRKAKSSAWNAIALTIAAQVYPSESRQLFALEKQNMYQNKNLLIYNK